MKNKNLISIYWYTKNVKKRYYRNDIQTVSVMRPIENSDGYHLHGKTGNSGWTIKWFASLLLEHFVNYGPLIRVIHVLYSFRSFQWIWVSFHPFPSSLKPSSVMKCWRMKFQTGQSVSNGHKWAKCWGILANILGVISVRLVFHIFLSTYCSV